MSLCRICSWAIRPGESSYSLSASRTTLSNVSLLFKVFDFLGIELCSDGRLCHVCFEIVEEIDFFEQNTALSKDKLRERLHLSEGTSADTEIRKKAGKKGNKKKIHSKVILSQIQFDAFRLRCPEGSLPSLNKYEDCLPCELCENVSFSSWDERIRHHLLVHNYNNKSEVNQAGYICPIDLAELNEPFDTHLREEHGVVGEWTSDFSFLKLGESACTPEEDQRKCDTCGIICTTQLSFAYHLVYHHKINPDPFNECPFCSLLCQSFKDLREHVLRVHCEAGEFSLPSHPDYDFNFQDCIDGPDVFLSLEDPPDTKFRSVLDHHLELITKVPKEIIEDKQGDEWDLLKLRFLLEDPSSDKEFVAPNEKKCFSCQRDFESHLQKISHRIEFHSGGNPFQCFFCLESFTREEGASRHVLEEHGFSSSNPWYLSEPHLTPDADGKIALGNGGYQCGDCALNCLTLTQVLIHRLSSHNPIPLPEYNCDYCLENCSSKFRMRLHVLICHGKYRYCCPACKTSSYETSGDFIAHIRSHLPESKFENKLYEKKDALSCALCHHNVRGPLMLSKHMQSIHGLKVQVDCGKCGIKFASYGDLTNHNRSVHTKSAPCQFCGKLFESRQSLEAHIATVHEGRTLPKEFMCESCSRTFSNKQLLQTHMRCHSSDKKITCKICGKAFKWESSLVSHTKAAHSSSTLMAQYDCKFCGKVFKDKSNLKNHVYTHTGEKPFQCDSCGKGFIRKDLMKSHSNFCQR